MRHMRGSFLMTAKSLTPSLSAVFVDYDNIYLSLKRKNDEAAKRFAKDAGAWVQEIATGRLITPTHAAFDNINRRIVMNRCYGNPVPRRNSQDNSTDMNSFPFVRHHFLRSGFEVVDCPPLTAQLKNSSDIRMVMDIRDYLNHDTYFDEFVILSGDADFTPLLHRLRAHARRTVIFANDYTVAPYTSISDGEVREADLINLLLEGRLPGETAEGEAIKIETDSARHEAIRKEIIDEVVNGVKAAAAPVPLEALADRALRNLGHEKTAGTSWAGAGGFRELLARHLPEGIKLSDAAPYYAFDVARHQAPAPAAIEAPEPKDAIAQAVQTPAQISAPAAVSVSSVVEQPEAVSAVATADAADAVEPEAPRAPQGAEQSYAAAAAAAASPQSAAPAAAPSVDSAQPIQQLAAAARPLAGAPVAPAPAATAQAPVQAAQPAQAQPASAPAPAAAAQAETSAQSAAAMQQSITRIHDACQAPPIAPIEYKVLFDVMACEINENGLTGAQTLTSIAARAQAKGIEISRDDVRFVLEVVSEADPWFEQGASANLFAGRFRNFVVARCRGQGLNLSADELDLIDAWFAGSEHNVQPGQQRPGQGQYRQQAAGYAQPQDSGLGESAAAPGDVVPAEEFPRIVRSRLRG